MITLSIDVLDRWINAIQGDLICIGTPCKSNCDALPLQEVILPFACKDYMDNSSLIFLMDIKAMRIIGGPIRYPFIPINLRLNLDKLKAGNVSIVFESYGLLQGDYLPPKLFWEDYKPDILIGKSDHYDIYISKLMNKLSIRDELINIPSHKSRKYISNDIGIEEHKVYIDSLISYIDMEIRDLIDDYPYKSL